MKKVNDEVYYATGNIIKLDKKDITSLELKSRNNKNKRIRICCYRNINDKIHEMFIVLRKGTYIRPHKHSHKTVSYHIIDGSADIIIFDDKGNIIELIKMGNYPSRRKFYYRFNETYYYTLNINSNYVIFHEVVNGPFKGSEFAPWSPNEDDETEIKKFLKNLKKSIELYSQKKFT